MNQIEFVLHRATVQRQAERDLKLHRLSIITSPYLVKFKKHNQSNTTFLHVVLIIFSPFYLSETTYVISLFNLIAVTKVNSRCNDHSMNL